MKKILFIEDELALREAFKDYLTKNGYAVECVSDGAIGVDTAKKEKPDLVLLDLILPKKSGFQVLTELKKDSATADIPVMVLTNLESPMDIDRVMEAGAVAYLIKTNYQLTDVLERIRVVIGE